MTVTQAYEDALIRRGYQADAAQSSAVGRLQRLYEGLVAFKAARSSRLKRLLNRSVVPQGVWLWGGVGRGKSFLMDCFYGAVPYTRKTRLHFHEFMRGVHRELEDLKGAPDPLDEVAHRIAKRYRLICFDEFHISDIADAKILDRLMRGMFEKGVVLVVTSNYRPDDLYWDGLHRDRLLPAIELLKQKLDVVNVDAGVDYRRQTMGSVHAYLTPLGSGTDEALRAAFIAIAETRDQDPSVNVQGRELRALRRAGGVVWFDFKTLCGGPRSQNDYLDLASRFHTVILSSVPQMSAAMASEARRFVWLIDVFYDQKIKLIMSAQCQPEQLYTVGAMVNEFQRTVSRIIEMQSRDYLNAPRRMVAERL